MTEHEWHRRKKLTHICVNCGTQDAYTLNGYTYCYECNERHKQRAVDYRKANRDELRVKDHERYERYVAAGRCVNCGRPKKVYETGTMCGRCAARRRVRANAANAVNRRRIDGVCYQCCNNAPLPGKKLCGECYDKNLLKLQKAWDARKKGGAND